VYVSASLIIFTVLDEFRRNGKNVVAAAGSEFRAWAVKPIATLPQGPICRRIGGTRGDTGSGTGAVNVSGKLAAASSQVSGNCL
jgi:hypothetical protein